MHAPTCAGTPGDEASEIAGNIEKLQAEHGVPLHEMAILLRCFRQGDLFSKTYAIIASELDQRGIKYHIVKVR